VINRRIRLHGRVSEVSHFKRNEKSQPESAGQGWGFHRRVHLMHFVVDDVGQLGVLPADCRGQLIHLARHRDARSLAENGRRGDPRPPARSERRTVGI
jgi:hypothetical protein